MSALYAVATPPPGLAGERLQQLSWSNCGKTPMMEVELFTQLQGMWTQ
jgi:hypothetical protein